MSLIHLNPEKRFESFLPLLRLWIQFKHPWTFSTCRYNLLGLFIATLVNAGISSPIIVSALPLPRGTPVIGSTCWIPINFAISLKTAGGKRQSTVTDTSHRVTTNYLLILQSSQCFFNVSQLHRVQPGELENPSTTKKCACIFARCILWFYMIRAIGVSRCVLCEYLYKKCVLFSTLPLCQQVRYAVLREYSGFSSIWGVWNSLSMAFTISRFQSIHYREPCRQYLFLNTSVLR